MALSDQACGCIAIEKAGDELATLVANPTSGLFTVISGLWKCEFDDDGNGFVVPVPMEEGDEGEPQWLVQLLPNAAVAKDNSGVLHCFAADGVQVTVDAMKEVRATQY
eukprot:8590261-Lingulodinium_polyedra.AAC.1